jgi:hypothetical protein
VRNVGHVHSHIRQHVSAQTSTVIIAGQDIHCVLTNLLKKKKLLEYNLNLIHVRLFLAYFAYFEKKNKIRFKRSHYCLPLPLNNWRVARRLFGTSSSKEGEM